MERVKDYLDYELYDDETESGGISFIGETLKDFIEEAGMSENTSIKHINDILKQCGIKPIK